MNKLVVGNLVHRPIRSLISVLAVAIEVIMILSIAAIMMGKLNGSKQRTSGIGMDMIVQPAAVNAFAGMSAASASVKVADILAKLPHVQVAAPMNIQLTNALDSISGIDFPSYNALTPFVFVEGGPFSRPDAQEIILDDYAGKGKHVGQQMTVLGKPFTICGIVQHGKGGRKFIPLVTMGALTGTEGKATNFYLKTEDEPKWQDAVKQEILHTEGLENYSVKTLEEQLSVLTPEKLPAFSISLNVVTGIAVVVGFLVIFQSMYTAVMERTREIGILKSLGASKSYIVNVVLRESMMLASVGIAVGVAASYLLGAVLQRYFPTLEFVINIPWVVRGVVLALIGALLGALYPAWKAASKDPIDALAYE
ncbi:MAG: ABC transporter permease [Acidobacteria bacterium]|nr:ABC transporter permease [Acidobacteriota bacterium]